MFDVRLFLPPTLWKGKQFLERLPLVQDSAVVAPCCVGVRPNYRTFTLAAEILQFWGIISMYEASVFHNMASLALFCMYRSIGPSVLGIKKRCVADFMTERFCKSLVSTETR